MNPAIAVALAGAFASGPNFAIDRWVCNAEDVLHANNRGLVTVIEDPLHVTSNFNDTDVRIDFGSGNVCGMPPPIKTVCHTTNRSNRDAVQVDLACEYVAEGGETTWSARGSLTIRKMTGLGRFECRSRAGLAGSVILNFSNCRLLRK